MGNPRELCVKRKCIKKKFRFEKHALLNRVSIVTMPVIVLFTAD